MSVGVVRSPTAHALATSRFSLSHSLSSSLVARLGIRSASSSGDKGVLPSLDRVGIVIGWRFPLEVGSFLRQFFPAPCQPLGPPKPWCVQQTGRFPKLVVSRATPRVPEYCHSWG